MNEPTLWFHPDGLISLRAAVRRDNGHNTAPIFRDLMYAYNGRTWQEGLAIRAAGVAAHAREEAAGHEQWLADRQAVLARPGTRVEQRWLHAPVPDPAAVAAAVNRAMNEMDI